MQQVAEAVIRRCSIEKAFLKILQTRRKHLSLSLFFNKVVGLRTATLLTKKLRRRCFLVNFAKFLRTPIFTEHFRWVFRHVILRTHGKALIMSRISNKPQLLIQYLEEIFIFSLKITKTATIHIIYVYSRNTTVFKGVIRTLSSICNEDLLRK